MTLSLGDPTTFVTRPVSAGLLAVCAILLIIAALPSVAKRRNAIFKEED